MNEWSPGSNFSRPATPNQSGRSFRSQKEEVERGGKPPVNVQKVLENRVRSSQPLSLEDVTKSSLSIASKRNANGASDPRFKRLVSNSFQNDACVGTDAKSLSKNLVVPLEERENGKMSQTCSTWTTRENKINILNESKEHCKLKKILPNDTEKKVTLAKEGNQNVEQVHQFKEVDQLMFSPDILVKSLSKESLSNCTANTINTSIASDYLLDDLPSEIPVIPSATRVNKVKNWIQEQNSKNLECKSIRKKQSHVTIIGQTKSQDPFNSALLEIDKRRQLVKELDKYAVCKKIVESDKEKEVSDLVMKITSLSSTAGKQSGEEKCERDTGSNSRPQSGLSQNGDADNDIDKKNSEKCGKISKCGKMDCCDIGSPLSQKRSPIRKKSRKSHLSCDYPIKGKFQNFIFHIQYQWVFLVVFLVSGLFGWIIFSSLHPSFRVSLDLFVKKPKEVTWYEKICMWLWEFFRPGNSYKRSNYWNSY